MESQTGQMTRRCTEDAPRCEHVGEQNPWRSRNGAGSLAIASRSSFLIVLVHLVCIRNASNVLRVAVYLQEFQFSNASQMQSTHGACSTAGSD